MHLQMDLPHGVALVLDTLEKAGYSAYVVGGCVRDALMGIRPHDFDVTTNARPEEMLAVFSSFRVIPTGIAHGTLTVLAEGLPVEVTAYRIDGEYQDSRHPTEVTFTTDLRRDAARRDFTVNAMAWSPTRGLQDFFGGCHDLQSKTIRTVGVAEDRFREDALRILRALRFASVLDFSIHEETKAAIFALKDSLAKISAERIRDELFKLLCGKNAKEILAEYQPVFTTVLPCLAPMKGFAQNNPWHDSNVWEHTLRVVSATPPLPHLRLAALLHDAGKPRTYTEDENGIGHFYGHGKESVTLAKEALSFLKVDNKFKERVLLLVELHDRKPPVEDKEIRRLLAGIGEEAFGELISLWRADAIGQSESAQSRLPLLAELEGRMAAIANEQPCLHVRDLAIDGKDLAAIGYASGPLMGKCLQQLLDAVIDGALPNEREALLRRATELMKEVQ